MQHFQIVAALGLMQQSDQIVEVVVQILGDRLLEAQLLLVRGRAPIRAGQGVLLQADQMAVGEVFAAFAQPELYAVPVQIGTLLVAVHAQLDGDAAQEALRFRILREDAGQVGGEPLQRDAQRVEAVQHDLHHLEEGGGPEGGAGGVLYKLHRYDRLVGQHRRLMVVVRVFVHEGVGATGRHDQYADERFDHFALRLLCVCPANVLLKR